MKETVSPYGYRDGIIDSIPIAMGYLFVSFGFGISAVGQGLRVLEALFISMTNLSSAGQLAGVSIIAAGGTVLEMFLTQTVISMRYALMGIALTQNMDSKFTNLKRIFLSFGITDEIFAMAVIKPRPVGSRYFAGLMTAPYLAWATGTLLGSVAGNFMPQRLTSAAGLLIYAMLIAIVIPPLRQEKGMIFAVSLTAVISCILYYVPVFEFVTGGFSIIICSVTVAALASLLFPVTGKEGSDREN